MALNSSNAAMIDKRRTHVARLRLAGLTLREIEESLPKMGIYNQDTGKPYSLRTVHLDVEAMRAEWQRDAAESMAELAADQLARMREVYRKAMLDKDYRVALSAIKQEVDLLGTARPKQLDVNSTGELTFRVVYGDDGTDG